MKKWFSDPKFLFTLLVIASIAAIAAGTYLGVALGILGTSPVGLLAAAGILLWAWAWGEFLAMCLRLRRRESAFVPATGRTLRSIGWCMEGLAAVMFVSAFFGSLRDLGFLLIEMILLPGIFLAVAVVAKILRGLLEHAMALEKEQEGVV